MSEEKSKNIANVVPVAVLGWLIPGMGQVWMGQVKRGVIIFVAIFAMFWSGIAIGGVMTLDRVYEKWWFYAQMLCGANSVVSWYRAENVYKELSLDEDVRQASADQKDIYSRMGYPVNRREVISTPAGRPDELQAVVDAKLAEKGIALVRPVDEVARAFTGIAGLMNLLCVFDAVMLAVASSFGEEKQEEGEK